MEIDAISNSLRVTALVRQAKTGAERTADQFYTKPEVAKWCLGILADYLTAQAVTADIYVEPSAGTGSFYDLLPANKLGFDIEPKADGICEGNFLNQALDFNNAITVGNPPFGKNSSLAIKFFNHAAGFSRIIAMIFPRTFIKISVQNRLDANFHLEVEQLLNPNSFLFCGRDYRVPCVFQIWVKKSTQRPRVGGELEDNDFRFVERSMGKFAIQRVGVNAGRVKEITDSIASASHYFLASTDEVRAAFECMWQQGAYQGCKYNTSGNPSISKRELLSAYREFRVTSSVRRR